MLKVPLFGDSLQLLNARFSSSTFGLRVFWTGERLTTPHCQLLLRISFAEARSVEEVQKKMKEPLGGVTAEGLVCCVCYNFILVVQAFDLARENISPGYKHMSVSMQESARCKCFEQTKHLTCSKKAASYRSSYPTERQ